MVTRIEGYWLNEIANTAGVPIEDLQLFGFNDHTTIYYKDKVHTIEYAAVPWFIDVVDIIIDWLRAELARED